jgi:hypothetical protein
MELLTEYKLKLGKLMKEKAELINSQNLFNIGTYVRVHMYTHNLNNLLKFDCATYFEN